VSTQVRGGLIIPVLLVFVLVLVNRRSVLGDAVNGRLFQVVATLAVGAIAVLALAVAVAVVVLHLT
jgi:Mn2+/Fe2+ NRAMP family transporter